MSKQSEYVAERAKEIAGGSSSTEKPANLKFQCQKSGNCCTSAGQSGFIFLTEQDTSRLSKFLDQSVESFADYGAFEFTRFSKGPAKVWFMKDSHEVCRFLDGKQCSVYEARPTQCRTWPYWPENMNAKAWGEIAKFCPGIGKGDDKDAEKYLKEQKEADEILR
jgi:Fe-S-cluster containining protein